MDVCAPFYLWVEETASAAASHSAEASLPTYTRALASSSRPGAVVSAPAKIQTQASALRLDEVLVANYTSLHKRLSQRLGCSDLASECLHEAWLRLIDMREAVSTIHPQAYVYRVAYHLEIDRLRRQPVWVDIDEIDTTLVDNAPQPYAVVEARKRLATVEQALLRLPPIHRALVVALRIEQRTRQDVAKEYHLSLARVDTLLHQALDYCIQTCGEATKPSTRGKRRPLPRRWWASQEQYEVVNG